MRRIIFKAMPFVLMVIMLSILSACGKAGPTAPPASQPTTPATSQPTTPATSQPTTPATSEPAATETGEPDYAGVATDTTLQGLSEDNLQKYTQYADAAFKEAVTQQTLDTTSAQIKSQLGTYESKEFVSVEVQSPYTIVHYKAKYTKGEIGVKMVFDTDHLVAGQWFE
jgi:predicted small lipoprotein YifL